jgi:hypothetical protein
MKDWESTQLGFTNSILNVSDLKKINYFSLKRIIIQKFHLLLVPQNQLACKQINTQSLALSRIYGCKQPNTLLVCK